MGPLAGGIAMVIRCYIKLQIWDTFRQSNAFSRLGLIPKQKQNLVRHLWHSLLETGTMKWLQFSSRPRIIWLIQMHSEILRYIGHVSGDRNTPSRLSLLQTAPK